MRVPLEAGLTTGKACIVGGGIGTGAGGGGLIKGLDMSIRMLLESSDGGVAVCNLS